MKSIIAGVIAATALTSTMALANGPTERYPYYSTSVSCSQLRSDLNAAGALIIYRAAHLYDRYVSQAGSCYAGDVKRLTTIPTRDSSHCRVFTCVQNPR